VSRQFCGKSFGHVLWTVLPPVFNKGEVNRDRLNEHGHAEDRA